MQNKSFIDLEPTYEFSLIEENERLKSILSYLEEENNRLQLEVEAYRVMSHGHRRYSREED